MRNRFSFRGGEITSQVLSLGAVVVLDYILVPWLANKTDQPLLSLIAGLIVSVLTIVALQKVSQWITSMPLARQSLSSLFRPKAGVFQLRQFLSPARVFSLIMLLSMLVTLFGDLLLFWSWK